MNDIITKELIEKVYTIDTDTVKFFTDTNLINMNELVWTVVLDPYYFSGINEKTGKINGTFFIMSCARDAYDIAINNINACSGMEFSQIRKMFPIKEFKTIFKDLVERNYIQRVMNQLADGHIVNRFYPSMEMCNA